MPSKGTTIRSVRVPDDIWTAAQEKAAAEARSVTEVVVEALRLYITPPPQKRRLQLNPGPLRVTKDADLTCRFCRKRAPWCSCGKADYR